MLMELFNKLKMVVEAVILKFWVPFIGEGRMYMLSYEK